MWTEEWFVWRVGWSVRGWVSGGARWCVRWWEWLHQQYHQWKNRSPGHHGHPPDWQLSMPVKHTGSLVSYVCSLAIKLQEIHKRGKHSACQRRGFAMLFVLDSTSCHAWLSREVESMHQFVSNIPRYDVNMLISLINSSHNWHTSNMCWPGIKILIISFLSNNRSIQLHLRRPCIFATVRTGKLYALDFVRAFRWYVVP